MDDYLRINWYRRCLIPYESAVSFLSRFCALNRIKVDHCYTFLGLESEFSLPLDKQQIYKISDLLGEKLEVVQSVFAPSISLNYLGTYSYRDSPYSNPLTFHYCEQCVTDGYHSYLHELPWMKRCPFHDEPINEIFVAHTQGLTRRKRLIRALTDLMEKRSEKWPWLHTDMQETWNLHVVDRISQWLSEVRKKANLLSEGEIWQSQSTNLQDESCLNDVLEQLHTLEPLPRMLEAYVSPIKYNWTVNIRKFPVDARSDFERIVPRLGFNLILEIYIYIGAHSNHPPTFSACLHKAKENIRKLHPKCSCRWGRAKGNWGRHYWVKRLHQGDWFWDSQCPYDVAIENLELGWGRADSIQWGPTADRRYIQMARFIKELHLLGVISYTSEAFLNEHQELILYPKVDPFCEWVLNSPFSELLNAAAEFEIIAKEEQLLSWIRAIESGEEPTARLLTSQSIRLCITGEGMTLIKWRRHV